MTLPISGAEGDLSRAVLSFEGPDTVRSLFPPHRLQRLHDLGVAAVEEEEKEKEKEDLYGSCSRRAGQNQRGGFFVFLQEWISVGC